MHKLTFIFVSTAVLTLSGCVFSPYQGYYSSTDQIWANPSPRYGQGSEVRMAQNKRSTESRGADRTPSSTAPYRTYTGTNRYGAGDSNRREYKPSVPPEDSPRVAERPASGAGYKPTPPAAPPAPSAPAGLSRANPDRPVDDSLAAPRPPAKNLPTAPPAPTPPSIAAADGPPPAKDTEQKPPPTANPGAEADEFNHLPFAIPVPGKAGYVTLPGPGAGLPQIDVRGIAPGTPVEIPDPKKSGSTIQFRVP